MDRQEDIFKKIIKIRQNLYPKELKAGLLTKESDTVPAQHQHSKIYVQTLSSPNLDHMLSGWMSRLRFTFGNCNNFLGIAIIHIKLHYSLTNSSYGSHELPLHR